MIFLSVLFLGIVGAAWASFLEVLADRLPRGERPFGRSRCVYCQRVLGVLDLVPILSWIMLQGKCRGCKTRIPARHLLFEAAVAALFILAFLTLPEPTDSWQFGFRLLMISALSVIFLADLRFFIIPDITSIGLFFFLSALLLPTLWFDPPWAHALPSITVAAWGAAFGVAFLGAFALLSRGTWMGWGDVKLAAALGAAFGFPAIILLLSFSFILGALISLVLMALRLRTMKDLIPFGPFIVLASLPFLFGLEPAIEKFFGINEFIRLL